MAEAYRNEINGNPVNATTHFMVVLPAEDKGTKIWLWIFSLSSKKKKDSCSEKSLRSQQWTIINLKWIWDAVFQSSNQAASPFFKMSNLKKYLA